MSKQGFTMVELIIVVAIIAIIAAIAIPNLLRSRLSANEAAAVAACKTYATAQATYRLTDWDGDGVKEYAKNIGPNGNYGNKESLFINVAKNSVIGLVDEAFANAETPGTGSPRTAVAKAGYVFMIQFAATYPTIKSYLDLSNKMILDFSISAVPSQYDGTGRNCFQMSSDSSIFQRDNGAAVHSAAYNVNPTNNWVKSE